MQPPRNQTLEGMHLPLRLAYLCINCDEVGGNANRCPACTSASLLSLSGVLNRAGEVSALVS